MFRIKLWLVGLVVCIGMAPAAFAVTTDSGLVGTVTVKDLDIPNAVTLNCAVRITVNTVQYGVNQNHPMIKEMLATALTAYTRGDALTVTVLEASDAGTTLDDDFGCNGAWEQGSPMGITELSIP